MADNKDVQYNFTGSTEGLKAAADSAIQILGSVSRAESNMNGIGSQSLSTFNAIKGVTASISNNIAQMQKQLKASSTLSLPAPKQQLALPAPTSIVPIQSALAPIQTTITGITQSANSMSTALGGSRMQAVIGVIGNIVRSVANMRNVIQSSATASQYAIDGEANSFIDANWRAIDAAEGKQKFARSNENVENSARRSASSIDGESRAFSVLKTSIKALMSPITFTVKGIEAIAKGAKSLTNVFSSLMGGTSKLGNVLKTLVGYTSGDLFGSAIQQSINFVETLELFQVACRNSLETAAEFVNQMQEMYGMDPGNIMDTTAYFYQLTAAIEAPIVASEKMSIGLTKAANDIASLFNMDVQKVAQNLSSGIQGMSRAVTKYGMDIRKTTLQEYAHKLGISEKVSEMSEASRQGLRYIAMMHQARAANGNWAKTIESCANQLRVFKEQMSQLGRSIGDFFTPMLAKILPVVNGIIMAIRTVLTYINAFVNLFKPKSFNQTTSAINNAAGAYGGFGSAAAGAADSAKKAGSAAKKAAKEASKSVAAFDQINKLDGEDHKTDSGGGIGGGGGGIGMEGVMAPAILDAINNIDTSLESVRMKANDVRDSILKFLGFTSESGDYTIRFNSDTNQWETDMKWSAEVFKQNLIDKFPGWKQTINSIFSNWSEIITSVQNLGKAIVDTVTTIVSPVKAAMKSAFTDEAVAGFVNNLSGYIDRITGIVTNIGTALNPIVEGIANGFSGISPIIQALGTAFEKISQALVPMGEALGPVIESFMIMSGNVIGQGITIIADAFSRLASETIPLLAPALNSIIEMFGSFSNTVGPIVSGIINALIDGLNLLAPALDSIVKSVGPPLIELFASVSSNLAPLISSIMPVLAELLTNIGEIIGQLIPHITNIVNAILPPLMSALQQILPIIMSVVNTALPPLMSVLDAILVPLTQIIQQIMPSLMNLLVGVLAPLGQMINQILPPLMSLLQTIIEPIMNIVQRLLPPLVELLTNLLVPIMEVVCAVLGALIAVLAPVIEVIVQIADVIISVLVAGIEVLINIINGVLEIVAKVIHVVAEVFNQIVTTCSGILQSVTGMIGSLVTWFRNVLNMLNGWIKGVIDIVVNFINNIVESVGNFLKGLWDLIDKACQIVVDIVKGLWDSIMVILNGLKDGFDAVWNGICWIVKTVINTIGDNISNAISFLGGLLSFVSDKLYNGWCTAWGKIKDFVAGIWDGITGAIKNSVNVVIKALNTLIKGANKLSWDIPDWVPGLGGKKFGLNIPTIPTLEGGGLVDAGQLFVAREAGPELVGNVGSKTAVLNNDQIVEAVARGVERANANVVRAIEKSGGAPAKLMVDKRVLAQVVTEVINDYGRSLGYSTVGLR